MGEERQTEGLDLTGLLVSGLKLRSCQRSGSADPEWPSFGASSWNSGHCIVRLEAVKSRTTVPP
jgi:hypothetical protein